MVEILHSRYSSKSYSVNTEGESTKDIQQANTHKNYKRKFRKEIQENTLQMKFVRTFYEGNTTVKSVKEI